MPDILWLAPGISVPRPDDGAQIRYSAEEAERVLSFFRLLVFGQNEWAGRPFELLPWEEQFIREFFGIQVLDDHGEWVRYRRFGYDEIPKKNGKTEFNAGLGLYFLLADGESRPHVAIFAVDKINADILYQCAKYMVEHTAMSEPKHRPMVYWRDSVREIRTRFGGLMKVYSSDAEGKHGYSFSAILCDEIHAWRGVAGHRLWTVLTQGTDAARRQQAVLVMTTAGDDPDRTSIGWELHERCRKLLAWRRGEPEEPLDGDDPQWLPTMYGISVLTGDDPERIAKLDIYDEELWRTCNPSYGVTLMPRQFRAEARAARQSEAAERSFRWLRLNQWIATKDIGWLPLTLYDKTQWGGTGTKAEREAAVASLRGKTCYGGLDLSTTTDLTAMTLLFPPQEGLETAVAIFAAWRPRDGVLEAEQRDHVPYRDWERAGFLSLCEGDIVDFSQVEDAAAEAAELFDLRMLGVDPYLSRTLTQRLSARGLHVVEIPQTMLSLSPAMKELERMIRAHEMLHIHNTCARWCFGNVRCAVDGNENIKPMKNRSTGRIDITVSWIIAMATWMVVRGQRDYDTRNLEEEWSL